MKHPFLLLFFCCNFLVSGFEQSTIVWSKTDQVPISSITKNDQILAFDSEVFCLDSVTIAPIKIQVESYVVISFENDAQPITCSRFQQFLTTNNEWKKAVDLSVGDCLQGAELVFVQSITVINQPIVLYDLCVIPNHTFCVGKQKIIAHNFVPFIGITLSFLFGAGTAIEWTIIGGIAAGVGFFGCAMNKNDKKKKATVKPIVSVAMPNPGNPDDPDNDENFFEKIKRKADKVVRTEKFGSMYRDPETQLWWSCDKARHGSSAYKVFKETARGFEWSHNVDMYGNIILNQHKGPIGLFISHKEVIVCR